MNITTISSRDFNRDVSRAKRAAEAGPVVITDRGRPAWVLLRHDAYRQLLDQPGTEEIEFDPPRIGTSTFRVPDLT
jgi:PHD/YefM family antitoxin component YafN of YafNO toxin-antitoxin module